MKKFINILAFSLFGALCFTGCYSNYTTPAPSKVYTDEDFSDLEHISIYELKEIYSEKLEVGGKELIEDDLYISGKVISCDKESNVYKSLYILDHSGEKPAAIELKLFASNYVFYPVGTMIYVKLKDLTLGDYRAMLSVGEASTNPKYANNNIENRITLDSHIFSGEVQPLEARDTLVVTKNNYMDLKDDALGRLVRFEDVESVWAQSTWGHQNNFPNYFAGVEDKFDWDAANYDWAPTFAHVSKDNVKYFGSSWYSYDSESSDIRGQYVVRVSSYARFKANLIPKHGQHLDLTAIYTRYDYNRSDYSSDAAFAASQKTAAYQLVLNKESDLQIR